MTQRELVLKMQTNASLRHRSHLTCVPKQIISSAVIKVGAPHDGEAREGEGNGAFDSCHPPALLHLVRDCLGPAISQQSNVPNFGQICPLWDEIWHFGQNLRSLKRAPSKYL